MDKKKQDLAWACLPKEARMAARETYRLVDREYKFHYGKRHAFETMFGKHNLTSDTEPEEMLMVERKKVQDAYKAITSDIRRAVLEELFGDKCLPDKNSEQPSIQVGDKVTIKGQKVVRTVAGITKNGLIKLVGKGGVYSVDFLEPYNKPSVQVEPKYNVGQMVVAKKVGMIGNIKSYDLERGMYCVCFKSEDDERNFEYSESDLEPYTESETKDNMEEEELDIYELLESNDNVKTIYSVVHDAEVEFKLANRYIEFMGLGYYSNGSMYDVAGRCMLYPSRALYEKYPLDAKKAWDEWASERKPKRWRAKQNESHWFIEATGEVSKGADNYYSDCDNCWMFGNYFRTESEAKQAAEAVRKCLMKFHESHAAD